MTDLYPLALQLQDKKVLIVGAGKVAHRKLQGLLNTGASITIISPEILPEISAHSKLNQSTITIVTRVFKPSDTKGFHIIYAATNNPSVNQSVVNSTEESQWVNDTANSNNSNFSTPAIIRDKGLVISLSTIEKNPTRAKQLKSVLAEYITNNPEFNPSIKPITQKNVMIAGTNSGAGKTTITLGIMNALKQRGLSVQPFKVGPDYIDTGWHSIATGRSSYNLDAFMLPEETLIARFFHHADKADVNIIEGVMGLFDGYGTDPTFCSSYGAAKLLGVPIILVVDGKAVSTSIAATVKGFQNFQQDTPIIGVIVNRVNSESHYTLLKNAIEQYCHIPVLGRLPNDPLLNLPERHLGLVPKEEGMREDYWRHLAAQVEKYIELDHLLELITQPKPQILELPRPNLNYVGLRIAIAKDEAFHFYYADNLELLTDLGIELISFSPLKDSVLPACNAIYIGGGFPEMFAEPLSMNIQMRSALLQAHQANIPIYAECGGLMYLGKTLITEEQQEYPMVGILEGFSHMTKGLKRFGYTSAIAKVDTLLALKGEILRGHEFHHSEFTTALPAAFTLQKIRDGEVISTWEGGYQVGNTLASYLHVHFYQSPMMLRNWLDRAIKKEGKTT